MPDRITRADFQPIPEDQRWAFSTDNPLEALYTQLSRLDEMKEPIGEPLHASYAFPVWEWHKLMAMLQTDIRLDPTFMWGDTGRKQNTGGTTPRG